MKKQNIIAGAAVLALIAVLAAPGWGENARGPIQRKIILYKVNKGDTLWGISRGQIRDPWQWPLLWRTNPKIKNPDRIYPGQKIAIPAMPAPALSKAKKEKEKAFLFLPPPQRAAKTCKTPPVKKAATAVKSRKQEVKIKVKQKVKNLFSDKEIISSGFIAGKISDAAVVTESPGGREIFTEGDDLYMKPAGPVSPGEEFLVAGISNVTDPVTDRFEGYLVEPRGLARVEGPAEGIVATEGEGTLYRAAVIRTFEGILPGDALISYREPEKVPAGTARKPMVTGHVLALKEGALIGAQLGVAYLNKGSAAGLKPGDLLQTMSGYRENALLQIISVRRETATAYIRKSQTVVRPGDRFGPDM